MDPPASRGLSLPQPAACRSRRRRHLEKQSGVPDIYWNSGRWAWAAAWHRFTPLKSICMGEAEAETAALEEAKLFRQKLLDQGVLSEPVQEDRPQSDVVGVSWQKEVQKWKVEIDTHGRKSYIGCFAEKGEAERRAKELHGTNEMVAVGHYSELPKVRPKSPYPGVCWIRRDQCWWAAVGSKGMRKHFRAKPKDFSEAELERSFEEVVSWLKTQKSPEEATSTAPKTFKRKNLVIGSPQDPFAWPVLGSIGCAASNVGKPSTEAKAFA
eukprot:symbB.v1.2.020096.t1/scaffold1638.1/size107986/1